LFLLQRYDEKPLLVRKNNVTFHQKYIHMKIINTITLLVGLLTCPFTISHGQDTSHGRKENVMLGVSQVNITPEVPIPMSGYDARKGPFTGVHDQLFASALYFKNEKTSLLLITSDLIGFNMEFVDKTQTMISDRIGIPPENIMITAAHNHGAPVTKAYETDVPKAVDEYVNKLQEKFINLAVQASGKLVPFRMGIGKSTCNMNINRRGEFADGSIWLGRNPDKPCDHELDVVKFEDLNNNTLAVLINWPCHGTTSGQQNTQITGDWPGIAAGFIKKQAAGELVVAVTAGASGDINPIYGPGDNFNEIEAVGYHVGRAAWKALGEITTFPVESLGAEAESIILPGKKMCKDHYPQKSYESGPEVEIRLITFKIGNLILAGISGEVMNEIGMAVKKQSPYAGTIIVTHCNGSSGYICTDKAFPEGGYEIQVTQLMPGAEKPLTNRLLQMINAF
jgi:neutral ceramidase